MRIQNIHTNIIISITAKSSLDFLAMAIMKTRTIHFLLMPYIISNVLTINTYLFCLCILFVGV